MISYTDPDTGEPLRREGPFLRGGRDWPVIDGIPFLRTGREELRRELCALLNAADERRALITALRDQDDFCPTPPPDPEQVAALLDDVTAGFRSSMQALAFGRVADYFAHRWSAPTFLSGLALMGLIAENGQPLCEVACGTGQLIAEAAKHGFDTFGSDVVFAKCWLGRRFVSPETFFVCCDADRNRLPFALNRRTNVLCHDAIYFFSDKKACLGSLRHLSGGGRIGVGHAHTDLDPTGIAGEPVPATEYKSLSPEACFYADCDLTDALLGQPLVPNLTETAEAVAFVEGGAPLDPERFAVPAGLDGLVRNPLLTQDGEGWRPEWTDERFAAEYRDATYLFTDTPLPGPGAPRAAIEEAARRRLLLDLPERWA